MDDTRSNEYFKLPLLPFSISLSQQLCGTALQRAFYQWLQIYLSCITIAAENVSMHLIYFATKNFFLAKYIKCIDTFSAAMVMQER